MNRMLKMLVDGVIGIMFITGMMYWTSILIKKLPALKALFAAI